MKLFGFSFLEPEPVPFWKGVLAAFPKVVKPKPVEPVVSRKAVMIASGVVVALALYKARNRLRQWIPGLQRVKTAFGCEPPIMVKATGTMKTAFESVRQGSTEQEMLPPKSQVLFGDMVAGEFHANGCGVRMSNWIVVPGHVFSGCESPCVKGRQHWVNLGKDRDYIDLDTDLIAIKLTEKELSIVGVQVSSISHSLPYSGDYVQIVGPLGKGTAGTLRHDRHVFGRVCYDGTTVAGYSGAAYTSGNRIVAIHTNGGAVNGGYSASYVYSLLCAHDRIKPEDSEDWLRNQFRKDKQRIRYDKRWNDLDEVRVEVNGRYAVVTRDAMVRAFGNDWADEILAWGEAPARSYQDESKSLSKKKKVKESKKPAGSETDDESSGEDQDSKSGVSSISANAPDQAIDAIVNIIQKLRFMSNGRVKKLVKQLRLQEPSSSQPSVLETAPSTSTQA